MLSRLPGGDIELWARSSGVHEPPFLVSSLEVKVVDKTLASFVFPLREVVTVTRHLHCKSSSNAVRADDSRYTDVWKRCSHKAASD